MTKVAVYVHKGICLCMDGWSEGIRYSGYFIILTRTNDYDDDDDDDAIIISSFSFHPPVTQCLCLLTKHRYRLQLNILIISLN